MASPARLQYTAVENVKNRLVNKVQFQRVQGAVQEGEMPDDFLSQLIVDAETEVEQDLRSRYFIPFQTKDDKPFRSLPEHSQRAIRMAVELKAVVIILQTDFGRGTHVDADPYIKSCSDHYEAYIEKLLGRNKEGDNSKIDRFRFAPPIEGMKLANTNREADDGYRGMIINTDASEHGAESYATDQLSGRIPRFLRPYGRRY